MQASRYYARLARRKSRFRFLTRVEIFSDIHNNCEGPLSFTTNKSLLYSPCPDHHIVKSYVSSRWPRPLLWHLLSAGPLECTVLVDWDGTRDGLRLGLLRIRSCSLLCSFIIHYYLEGNKCFYSVLRC
jgi:hypothetical protein